MATSHQSSKPRLKMADIALLAQRHDRYARDVVQTVKKVYHAPVRTPGMDLVETKVAIRKGLHYKGAKNPEAWREKYHRRLKQSRDGFATPSHVPYASIGDVIVNTRELVFTSLELADPVVVNDDKYEFGKDINGTAKKAQLRKTITPRESDGGLRDIQDMIKVHCKRVRELQAGQRYHNCLQNEAKQKADNIKHSEQALITPEALRDILAKSRLNRHSLSSEQKQESGTTVSGHDSEEEEDILGLR
ncbi:uncharacterized protein LOC125573707 [Nematostella vectensis]|uniref:uncharacterized protein LOC125573707 n=1 Tax=Nematostella vectensis TaxID=45351 RepID=UPI00207725FD|nr:uncharacterized protein LOC125573707 [Nematostella vectensis]